MLLRRLIALTVVTVTVLALPLRGVGTEVLPQP
jgi:hypothetical protein